MRQFKVTHDAKAVLVAWWCLVTIGSGLMAVDETAALENAKTIKVEKLLTLIRVSELEAEYDALTQKYVSEYEQQIRKSIGSTYSNLTGEKKKEIERLLDAFLQDIRKSIGQVESLHDHLKQAYSRSFGEDELDRLIAHYSSPVGEKDAGMKKSAAIEYNKMWTEQFMNQYKARVEKLFQVVAVVAKGKGKQGA
jgi:DNA replication initiation complex subunit (GINS family)